MGISLILTAVTDEQIKKFASNPAAQKKFMDRASDPSALLLRTFGKKIQNTQAFIQLGKALGMNKGADNSTKFFETVRQVDLDKAWHGLHWILTGSTDQGPEPLCYLVHKGQTLAPFHDSDVRAITSQQLAAFEAALQAIDETELRSRYDGEKMAAAHLYLSTLWLRSKEEGVDILMTALSRLKNFLQEAKAHNEGMLIWTT